MSGGIDISLQELITSGCLSTCTFSCHNNNHLHHNHVNNSNNNSSKDLQCLNACKLSLLLVQTVARYGNDEGIDYFASLTLSNFIVRLHNDELVNIEVVDDGEDEVDFDDTPLPLDFKSEPTFDENDETTLDILSELFTDDVHPSTEGENNNNNIENGGNKNEHDVVRRRRSSLISHASSGTSHDGDKFDIILRANGHEVHWTLRGMEILAHTNKNEEKKSETISPHDPPEISMLQIIGKMICQIFSHQYNNKQTTSLPSIFKRLSIAMGKSGYHQCNNGVNNDLEQRNKKRVYKEESLFSELIEDDYPVSICRLLSDMIDIGINGKADSPFTTLDDVITDLEQMSTYPEVFLYNPEDSFSSNLRFGGRCYGRESQVASILGVASKVEGNSIQEPSPTDGLETIFISGIAGSGKSFLAHKTAERLEKSSWIVIGAKFEMGLEHKSRDVVCSVFDTLVTNLLTMRDGDVEEDILYYQCAIKAISDLLDRDDITTLASVIPRIQDLVGDDTMDEDNSDCEAGKSDEKCSYWRLVFLLSSLLGALVSLDRKILVYYDDLQWCNPSMTSLICEVIQSVAKLPRAKDWFLFMGLYRDIEVDNADSSFIKQYEGLQQNKDINVTSINLPSFSKADLTNMMMAEMRLPHRLVADFAGIVHRKTSGHVLFVIQLLNSLVRDAIVVYSPTKHRYYWDNKQLDELQMGDSVASMIVANLSCLSEADLQCLKILSCFGQVHQSIIYHLASCSDINERAFDIASSLQSLVDAGIIEVSSTSMLQFSHDLIHEQVYNGIAIERRHQLHLSIGLSIGSQTTLDADGKMLNSSSTQNADVEISEKKEGEPIDATMSTLPKSIASIATHQINNAEEVIVDHSQRVRFACWNAVAAEEQSGNSNFQSSLHYYKKGIEFLGGWASDAEEISYKLHKGIAATLLSLGKEEDVTKYATIIIENVPFDRSLEAQTLVIRSMQQKGSKDKEAIAMVIALLRKLGGFNIPSYTQIYASYFVAGVSSLFSTTESPLLLSPLLSVKIVTESIARIDELSLKYNLDDCIDQMTVIVDRSKRDMLDVLECIIFSCLRTRSPYLPIIVCEMIKYSLEQDCLCGESALSFALFAYMKIWINDDWEEARRWGKLTTRILDKFKCHQFICARVTYFTLLQVWDRSLKENIHDLLKVHEMGMKAGAVELSQFALVYHLRYQLFDGEVSLLTLKAKYDLYLTEMQKFNTSATKGSVLDSFVIHSLMGLPCNAFAIFDGKINNLDELLENVKDNRVQTMCIYYARFFAAAYLGNMKEASEASKNVTTAASKYLGPMPIRVYHTFFNGIVSFQLYREGEGDAYFDEGVQMLRILNKWERKSALIVKKSMSLLLSAEFYASNCEVNKAKETYKAAIQTSLTYMEQAVSYEKLGNYLSEICEVNEAQEMHKNAYICYKKWGAKAVADKLLKEHPFELTELEESAINSMKRKGEG